MCDVTRLVHLKNAADRESVVTRIAGSLPDNVRERALIAPTSPGVRNGGDVLVRLRFESSDEWEAVRSQVDAALRGPDVRHVDGAEYVGGVGNDSWRGRRVEAPAPTVYRALLLRVEDAASPALVERFERELLQMPQHVRSMTSWQLSRVQTATGASRWTHVWEQTFTDLDGLLGEYMAHPVHWGLVDRWFDPECPDQIVKDRVCHSFCALTD
ncbi:Dabb family protein [Rhodococcus gannanensis]|uniref:Dabb family protein n=1 Tax=Rhodococcus gannanensis TaxID=1960308 RepID=UPI00366DAF2C